MFIPVSSSKQSQSWTHLSETTNLYNKIIKLIDKLNVVLNTAYSSRISPELIKSLIEVGHF